VKRVRLVFALIACTSPAMVHIPGGEFSMGSDELPDARPVHRVRVSEFWMDRTEVTNAEFARFVRATGYVTVAEKIPENVPPDKRVAGSAVFTPPPGPVPLDNHFRWWSYVVRADWRHPLGPGSDFREQFPVVHVAYEDAAAYCAWAGKRLPTEAEFEYAARGGLAGRRYAWGDELRPGGKWMANTFQGHFPDEDTGEDGWIGAAPVASFPPNGFGLYDVAGNVWEWCRDWYGAGERAIRGGSFLCTPQYCARYLVAARGRADPSTGSNHLGFRCVR
jgi:formylglycine-generating enzyme required for sulfatase activity